MGSIPSGGVHRISDQASVPVVVCRLAVRLLFAEQDLKPRSRRAQLIERMLDVRTLLLKRRNTLG